MRPISDADALPGQYVPHRGWVHASRRCAPGCDGWRRRWHRHLTRIRGIQQPLWTSNPRVRPTLRIAPDSPQAPLAHFELFEDLARERSKLVALRQCFAVEDLT